MILLAVTFASVSACWAQVWPVTIARMTNMTLCIMIPRVEKVQSIETDIPFLFFLAEPCSRATSRRVLYAL